MVEMVRILSRFEFVNCRLHLLRPYARVNLANQWRWKYNCQQTGPSKTYSYDTPSADEPQQLPVIWRIRSQKCIQTIWQWVRSLNSRRF